MLHQSDLHDRLSVKEIFLDHQILCWGEIETGAFGLCPATHTTNPTVRQCWWFHICQQPGLNDWSGIIEEWNEKITPIYLMKTWSAALRASDWAEGSPFNKLITLNTIPGDFGTTLNVLGRPDRTLTGTQSGISGGTWEYISMDKNVRTSHNPGLQSLEYFTQDTWRLYQLSKGYSNQSELDQNWNWIHIERKLLFLSVNKAKTSHTPAVLQTTTTQEYTSW